MKTKILLCLAILSTLPPATAFMQTTCNPSVASAGSNFTWAWGQTVEVAFVGGGFTSAQMSAIQSVFNNWAGAGNSGVSFSFVSSFSGTRPTYELWQGIAAGMSSSAQGHTGRFPDGQPDLQRAWTYINPGVTDLTAIKQVASHEVGHTFGLNDCPGCASGSSAMTLPPSADLNALGGRDNPGPCDNDAVNRNANGKYPQNTTPPCSPTGPPTCGGGSCSGYTCTWNTMLCQFDCVTSPIVIDLNNNGINLTNAVNGVDFDLDCDGVKERRAWTSAGSDDAWLFLDRNGNGIVDNGTELFGNITPQPEPPAGEEKNGFRALAEFDKTINGGNGNGWIDAGDSVFSSLRLWRDLDHDGYCELNELSSLTSFNITGLDSNFIYSRLQDQHGNLFKYRARIKRFGVLAGYAWDVFLVRD